MNFSTLFRLEENLNLDKKTLVILRYIAIIGQLIAINLVFFGLQLQFPVFITYLIILVGFCSNLLLQFGVKTIQLKDFYAGCFLTYDLIQLSLLLYLTGGISNPFSILLIIPAIVSSTFLSMGTTILLGIFTLFFLVVISFFHFPLPGMYESSFSFPKFYLIGFFISIIIGLIFLCYFGIRFAGESKKRSEALNTLEQIISKEYELESLGGQAAAAAHSLGTPLATITVVAKELKKEIEFDNKHSKDLDLLISQAKRCGEILKQIAQKKIIEDKFLGSVKLEDLLTEIIRSFNETSSKIINLDVSNDKNKININRTPEIIYGLRNFIGNAVKFSKSKVKIKILSDNKRMIVEISDDGPGFPNDIIGMLGEPYIKSKSKELNNNAGTGLGTFLGKTLLNRQGAKVTFANHKKDKRGALVKIYFDILNLTK